MPAPSSPNPSGPTAKPQPTPHAAIGHNELRQALEISMLREDLERITDDAGGLVDHIESAVEKVRQQVAPLDAEALADPDVMAPLLQFAVSTLITIRDRARALDIRTGIADDANRPAWDANRPAWDAGANSEPDMPPARRSPIPTLAAPAKPTQNAPRQHAPEPLEATGPAAESREPPHQPLPTATRARPLPPAPRPLTPQGPAELNLFAPVSTVTTQPSIPAPASVPPMPMPPAPPHRPNRPAAPANLLEPTSAKTKTDVNWLSPAGR